MRAELTIAALVVFAALHGLRALLGWTFHPLWIFPMTLATLFLFGIGGAVVEKVRCKGENSRGHAGE